jgi:hypothetical protein
MVLSTFTDAGTFDAFGTSISSSGPGFDGFVDGGFQSRVRPGLIATEFSDSLQIEVRAWYGIRYTVRLGSSTIATVASVFPMHNIITNRGQRWASDIFFRGQIRGTANQLNHGTIAQTSFTSIDTADDFTSHPNWIFNDPDVIALDSTWPFTIATNGTSPSPTVFSTIPGFTNPAFVLQWLQIDGRVGSTPSSSATIRGAALMNTNSNTFFKRLLATAVTSEVIVFPDTFNPSFGSGEINGITTHILWEIQALANSIVP